MIQILSFLKGFAIVSLTAMNVIQVSHEQYRSAFIGGFLISFVWWINSHTAAHAASGGCREAYALGGACGTIVGMWLATYLSW